MKTQKRQVTITDLYNLVAHETVSLLEAVDDNAIPLALEMREGLTMLAAAAGSGEGVETHLEWIDQEIENLKQTAGTPQCVTHLIPTSQLVRTVATSRAARSAPPPICTTTSATWPPERAPSTWRY